MININNRIKHINSYLLLIFYLCLVEKIKQYDQKNK
jgi:hypothetical protein